MSESLAGDTSKTAVSQYAETNKQRDVLTKQVNAGQQTVVATEPRKRDGGRREEIIRAFDTPNPCMQGRAVCLELPSGGEGSAHSQSLSELLRGKILWSRPALLWRGFLRECRSFYHRMGNLDIVSAVRFGAGSDLAPQIPRASHHPLCNRTNLRIRDTKTLFARLPWVTPWDVELFVSGWELGAKSAALDACNCEIYRRLPIPNNSASANPDGSNSMPPSEVQQSPRHDPSNPLP